MRKIHIYYYAVVAIFFLTTAHAASNEERLLLLEKKIQQIEQRLKALEGPKGVTSSIPKPTRQVETNRIKLGKWAYSFTEYNNSDYYRISYEIVNNHDKGIRRIDASLRFEDREGEHLYGILITPNARIAANRMRKDTGLYRLNRFMKNHYRMADMKPWDVIPKLHIRKVEFEDNTAIAFSSKREKKWVTPYSSHPDMRKYTQAFR